MKYITKTITYIITHFWWIIGILILVLIIFNKINKSNKEQLELKKRLIETERKSKEELLKSPKDLEDARHLRIVYSDLVNEEEMKIVKKLIKRFRL